MTVSSTSSVVATNSSPYPLTSGSTLQRRVKGDYNRDGIGDFSFVAKSGGSTTYVANLSGLGGLGNLGWVLNREWDALVPGDFDGDGRTEPATVFVLPDGNLEWNFINTAGAATSTNFGVNGDTPLVGDVDCDGRDERSCCQNKRHDGSFGLVCAGRS